MTQIILAESDDTLRKILKLNLMQRLGCDVIEKQSAEEVTGLLEIIPNIDLVIVRDIINSEETGLDVASYLEQEKGVVPILLLGKTISTYKQLTTIAAQATWEDIIKSAGKILGIETSSEENLIASEYIAVGVHYFLNINSPKIGCDIYIRVRKSDDEYQFIKRFQANEPYNKSEILKYQEKGLADFYVTKDHFSSFVNFVTNELVSQLDRMKLEGSDRVALTSEAFELTLERIHSLGVDENTIEIVQGSILSMETSLKENNNLGTFLKTLKSNEVSYAYSHAYLTCLILHKVVTQFDWCSDKIKEKLTYIAYFHDISLKDSALMEINTFEDLEMSKLSSDNKNIINNHALQSSMIIERFPKVPTGTDIVIKEHHGSKNGIGLPDSLSISISPLSMMFIVVEHFVGEFLKIKGNPTNENIKDIFTILEKRYNKLTYLQTFVALQNMTLNKK